MALSKAHLSASEHPNRKLADSWSSWLSSFNCSRSGELIGSAELLQADRIYYRGRFLVATNTKKKKRKKETKTKAKTDRLV